MPVSTSRFFLVNTCLNLVTGLFHDSGVSLSSVEWMAIQVSLSVGRVQVPQSLRCIQAGMIPKKLDYSSLDGIERWAPAQIQSRVEGLVSPHQGVCSSPVSVLNCEWKSSVWAHTGTLEEWTLSVWEPCSQLEEGHFPPPVPSRQF